MATKCCENCVYATQAEGHWHRVMMRRFPGLRLCFNSVEAPGRMHEVRVNQLCENFRPRRWSRGQRSRPRASYRDEIRYIPLTHGLYAIVDAEDYEKLSKHKWAALFSQRGNLIYAARSGDCGESGKRKRTTILMHREIMNPPEGMVVDHINHFGLNNRRCNLRNCTPAQNIQNCRPRKNGKSQYIGVFPFRGKWRATIASKGERYYLGLFDDEVEAAKARDRKAIELFGEFARLNFPL